MTRIGDPVGTGAALLRDVREGAGLLQCDLAARAGVSKAALSSYETGRRPMSLDLLERLLALCGVKLRAVVELTVDAQERGLAALEGTSPEQRLPTSCQWIYNHLNELDVRWGGALAACLQGVPVLPIRPVLAVTVDEVELLARAAHDSWWFGTLDTARLRIEGRLRGEDWSGTRRTEIVLLSEEVRERHLMDRFGLCQRLVALEDLTPDDVDPAAAAGTLRSGRLHDWELQPAARITTRRVVSTYDPWAQG